MKKSKLLISTGLVCIISSAMAFSAFAATSVVKKADVVSGNSDKTIRQDCQDFKGEFGKGRFFGKVHEQPMTLDEFKEKIAQLVTDGKLTQEEADQKIADFQARIENGDTVENFHKQPLTLDKFKEKITQLVTDGKLTHEEADQKIADFENFISERLNKQPVSETTNE